MRRRSLMAVLLSLGALAPVALAHARLAGSELVQALHRGGFVLVMRHASAPLAAPPRAKADPENPRAERQLDEAGREQARQIGAAIRRLGVPIGVVLVSPTYRTRETARLAGLLHARTAEDLGEGPRGMSPAAGRGRARWLEHEVAQPPVAGTNTLLITHAPNMVAAFGAQAKGIAAGEILVLRPDGHGGSTPVARITPQEWTALHR